MFLKFKRSSSFLFPFHNPNPHLRLHSLLSSSHSHPPPPPPLPPTQQTQQPMIDDDDDSRQVSAIFDIIVSSPTPRSMSHSLGPYLPSLSSSPSLLDSVLKRARFAHANPLRTLHFFHLALSSTTHPSPSPSPFSFDTMLYILGRARRFPDCWSLLLLMKHNHSNLLSTRTLHIVLARIAKVCSVRQTLESFNKFRRLIRPFDTACFNALLRTLCQEKTMSDARNVYHSLKYEFKPDVQTFNVLLSGWRTAEDAEAFFEEMKELNVMPDLVSYNCLIDCYCKNKELDKARRVFDEMREREIWPDVISYTSLIGGLGLIGQPDKARDVLREMREVGCVPDVAAYNAAIRNFCIAKRMGNALALMDEMGSRGLAPNATSYNLFFRVFYWANDLESAWRLYGRMKEGEGCLPNVQSCMFLVRLCRRRERVETALELWGDMVEKGFGSFRLVSDVLFDLLCDWGKLEEAEKCFVQMVERGQKPSNVSFRRLKVLMELANKQESVRKLSEKMESFGNAVELDHRERETEREERGLNF